MKRYKWEQEQISHMKVREGESERQAGYQAVRFCLAWRLCWRLDLCLALASPASLRGTPGSAGWCCVQRAPQVNTVEALLPLSGPTCRNTSLALVTALPSSRARRSPRRRRWRRWCGAG